MQQHEDECACILHDEYQRLCKGISSFGLILMTIDAVQHILYAVHHTMGVSDASYNTPDAMC